MIGGEHYNGQFEAVCECFDTDAALERIMFTVFPKWLTQVRKMRRAAKA
jgi:hypothetical protein